MASKRWIGAALAVAQIDTYTPANVEVDDIFTITINGKSISFTATATTVVNVTAGIVALLNASTEPEFAEVTWSDETTHVQGLADTAGLPFTGTSAAVDGGVADTQTFVQATTTAATGPNHWDNAKNWDGGVVPTGNGADDVFFDNSDVSVLYGVAQSAVTLTSLHLHPSFTGAIGLPKTNVGGYPEYRADYLAISVTNAYVGRGEGSGSGRIKIDLGTNASTFEVTKTGTALESDIPAVLLKGTHAGNVLSVFAGTVGVAFFGGEVSTIATIRHSGGTVSCSSGVTLTTIERSGSGLLSVLSNVTTLNQSGGTTQIGNSATLGTATMEGGTLDYRSSGTITTLNIDGDNALTDFSRDLRARTVTTANLKQGRVKDPHQTVTWTNGLAPGGKTREVVAT